MALDGGTGMDESPSGDLPSPALGRGSSSEGRVDMLLPSDMYCDPLAPDARDEDEPDRWSFSRGGGARSILRTPGEAATEGGPRPLEELDRADSMPTLPVTISRFPRPLDCTKDLPGRPAEGGGAVMVKLMSSGTSVLVYVR